MEDNIQNYVVFERIGQGGFGQVFRAKCKKDDREYAIKFIARMTLDNNAELRSKVAKEVTIHSQLLHPCILELVSCFEDENFIYLVLELCHNKDLKTFLKSRKRLTEDEARSFMKQIVDGLRYLHRHGILHRDITLANILLTANNDVKIADFGLAMKLNEPDEKDFAMCGTPNYIAPEVASRSGYGLEADVWSLGCVMYTLLVGHPPFVAESIRKTLERVIKDKFDIPDWVSPEARKLINAILRKNPKERPRFDEILNHPFFTRKPLQDYDAGYSKSKFGSHGEFSQDSGHDTLGTMSSMGSRSALNDDGRVKQSRPTASQQLRGNVENRTASGSSRERMKGSRSGPVVALKNYPSIPLTLQQSNASVINDSQPRPLTNVNSYPEENAQVPSSSYGRQRNYRRPLASKNDIDVPQSLPNHSPSSSNALLETENRPPKLLHRMGNNLRGKSYSQRKENTSSDSGYDNYTSENGSRYACSTDISVDVSNTRDILPTKPNMHSSNSKLDMVDRGRSLERQTRGRVDSLQQQTRSQSQSMVRGEEKKKAERNAESIRTVGVPSGETNSNHPQMVLPSPINTARLRPQRQRTKFAVLSILDDGWVCLEFFKAGSDGRDWVTDVLRISADGLKIEAFAPNGGTGCILQSQPPKTVEHGCKQFSYDRLPKSYWKKYLYASRFANLVRSRTPKVTYYIPEAKVTLMENLPDPDLEVIFFDGVTFTKKTDEMQIVMSDGSTLKLKDSYDMEDLPRSTREKYETVIRAENMCRQLESLLSKFEEEHGISCFPVTLNRPPIRPSQENTGEKVNCFSDQLQGCAPSISEGSSQIRPRIEGLFSNQSTNISNGQLAHSYNSHPIAPGLSEYQSGMSSDDNRGQQRPVQSNKR